MIRSKIIGSLILISANANANANANLDFSYLVDINTQDASEEKCISYERLNPAFYIVNVDCKDSNYVLNFKESFHHGWKAYFSLKPHNGNNKINYSFKESYLSERIVDDKIKYMLEKNFRPSISGTILLNDDLHFRINDIFNGWVIDNQLIEFLSNQDAINISDNNIQFTLYLVFYSEIIKQVWLRIMALIIGFILGIFFIKRLVIKRI